MKKLLFIFAFIFIFSFAFACGEKEDEKKQDDNKQEEQKPDEPKDEPEQPETKEFTVKFVVDGEETILKVVEGEKANKPIDPVKEGYKFIGWFIGSEEYDFEKVVTSDLELTAMFEKISRYDLIKEKGVIVITTSPDYAPYEFIDGTKTGQDRYVGCDVGLMKYIAEKLGVKLEIIVTDFDTTFSLIQNGNADLGIAAYVYDQKKVEKFELSKPYDEEGSETAYLNL